MNEIDKDPMDRLFKEVECRTQTELADMLGIKQSSISDAQKRNAMPAEWLVKLLRLKGTNPEWILTGFGRQKLGPVKGEPATV